MFRRFLLGVAAIVISFATGSLGGKCISQAFVPMDPSSMYGINATAATVMSYYREVEAFLQIYQHMRLPCSGWIQSLVLYPAQPQIEQLNIATFRKTTDGYIVIVDIRHIHNVIPPAGNNGWFYYHFDDLMPATEGDYIGIFYDHWGLNHDRLTIRSADAKLVEAVRPFVKEDTLIYKLDNRLVAPGSSMVIADATTRKRLPALVVKLVPDRPTTVPPTSPTPAGLPNRCSMDLLPADLNCPNTTRRYRYSATPPGCYEFLGCDTMSTSNNYDTPRDCLNLCVWPFSTTSSPLPTRPEVDSAQTDYRCFKQLTVDDTDCDYGKIERWQFNQFYRKCSPFIGCDLGEVGNNWDTQYQCQAACRRGNSSDPTIADARCTTDPTLGQWLCLYKETRYHWDVESNSCQSFPGCPYRNIMGFPIGNNFASFASCVSSCASLAVSSPVEPTTPRSK